jgi:hypothetical protein
LGMPSLTSGSGVNAPSTNTGASSTNCASTPSENCSSTN